MYNYVPTQNQFDFFCNKILNQEYYSFIRYTHGLWDKIERSGVNHHLVKVNSKKDIELAAKIYCEYKQDGGWVMTEDVMIECFHFLANIDRYSDKIFMGVSSAGNPSVENQKNIKEKQRAHEKIFKKFSIPAIPFYDGLLWKRAVLNGSFLNLIKLIKDKNIILVAPEEVNEKNEIYLMKNLGKRLGINNFSFIEIHPKEASKQYNYLLQAVGHYNNKIKNDKVFLFKAGPIGVSVITKLHDDNKNTFMLDIGNALDIFSPGISRNWKDKNNAIVENIYRQIDKK